MNGLFSTACDLARSRQMIWVMAVRDMQARYVGSVGGFLWVVAQPLAMVAVYYFVFAVGFRAQGPTGTSYVVWFVGGLVPWMFFAETLGPITNSVVGNAHLVKKTLFPSEDRGQDRGFCFPSCRKGYRDPRVTSSRIKT